MKEHYLKTELYELIKTDESIFDFIQESSLDGLWYWDLEQPEHEWMNPKFWMTLGYDHNDMPHLAEAWRSMVHADDLAMAVKLVEQHLRDPSIPYDQIIRYFHKNGGTVWIRCRGMAIFNAQGQPYRMLGAHVDITRDKEQAEELKRANSRLQALLNTSGDLSFVLNEDLVFTEYFFHDSNEDLYVPPSVFVGKKISEIGFPDEPLALIAHAVETTIATGQKAVTDYRMDHPSGPRWYNLISSLLSDGKGKGVEVLCVVHNITKRKIAEEELIRTKEILEKTGQMARVGGWNYDLSSMELYWSDMTKQIHGVGPDFVPTPERLSKIYQSDEGRALIDNSGARAALDGTPFDHEVLMLKPDGTEHWVRVKGEAEFVDGVCVRLFGTTQDIDQQVKSRQALMESEARFRFVAENTLDGILIFKNGKIVYVSDSYEAIFGYSYEDKKDMDIECLYSLIHPDDVHKVRLDFCNQLHDKSKGLVREYRMKHKQGHYVWREEKLSLNYGENNTFTIIVIARDITERKLAEVELLATKERLESLIEAIPDAIFFKDGDSRWLITNEAAKRIFKLHGFDWLNKTEHQLAQERPELADVHETCYIDDEAAWHNRELTIFKEVVKNDAGENREYEVRKMPLFHPDGSRKALVIIGSDITERNLSENALQESRELLLYKSGILSAIAKTTENLLVSNNISETVQEALELIGKSTKVDRMYYFENDTKTNLVSHKNEWIAGNASIEINNPLLQNMTFDDLGEYMPKLLNNKPYVNFARNVRHPKVSQRLKDQGTVSILLLPIFIKNNFHGFIGFDDCSRERVWTEDELNILQSLATNIANGIERINNETIIKENERNFRQINETIEDVFWLFDVVNNRVDYISPSSEKILGRNPESIYGDYYSWKDYVLEEDHALVLKNYQDMHAKDHFEMEYRIRVNDEIRWIAEKSFAIKDESGKIIKHSGICTDITDKVEKNNQLIHLLDVTSDQNKRLLNFAHIVSHNIRSHSSNLSMLVDFMENADNPEEMENSLKMLRQSTDRLAETIENLNEIITVQNNVNSPKTQLFVRQELLKVAGVLNTLIQETNATIHIDIDPLVSVKAISAYVESIFLNLMTNAIKYRSPERAPSIHIGMEKEGNYLVLSFSDNGVGLDLHKHGHKLFGMYKTFHSNKDARGIGLFITKNQIEAMGGKIEAESTVGIGSTFKVYFNEND